MGRYDSAVEIGPYSDRCPDRCEPRRGARFVLPGEDEPRECGADSAMPPNGEPHWKRRVRRGYEDLKR